MHMYCMQYCLPNYIVLFCSKIIGHVISDVYQFAQSSVASLWTICCQLLQTGLLHIKQVCFWEARTVSDSSKQWEITCIHCRKTTKKILILVFCTNLSVDYNTVTGFSLQGGTRVPGISTYLLSKLYIKKFPSEYSSLTTSSLVVALLLQNNENP